MFTEAFLLIKGRTLADSIGAQEADGVTAYGYVDPADGIRFYCFAGADFENKKMLEKTDDPRIVSYNSVFIRSFRKHRLHSTYRACAVCAGA